MIEGKSAEALMELIERFGSTQELSESERTELVAVASGTDTIALAPELAAEPEEDLRKPGAGDNTDIRSKLLTMKLPEKVKLAMFGNSVCRRLLVGDANKMVQSAVLKNPQLQMREVAEFAKNPNCSEHVLRSIAGNQQWIRDYGIKKNLVMNPKAPVDVTVKWLKFLNQPDLKTVARSKGLPQALITAAKKKMANEGPG